MPLVVILSSHVAASDVGGAAQVVALTRLGLETALAPTVLFGRHPGHGPPGGGPVTAEIFEGMLRGLEADGILERADAIVTGYFAGTGQITSAARFIDAARAANPTVRIVVDPIMGDSPKGLYIAEAVAESIVAELVPRADLLAPNAWELARLTGLSLDDPLAAARAASRPVLVSSIDLGERIGVLYADADQAWLASHHRLEHAPNGTGDRLTAHFTAALMLGGSPRDALAEAVGAVAVSLGIDGDIHLEGLT
jgi:pyridoxine kinase